MKYKENWEGTKQRWTQYWTGANKGTPLMYVVARKPEEQAAFEQGIDTTPAEFIPVDADEKYQNPEKLVGRFRHYCETHDFLADSFPNMSVDFGPGSLASYLGSEIRFHDDTVWFEPCIDPDDDWEDVPELKFDPDNKWFKKHCEAAKRCVELAGDDFIVAIPDLMENLDVLASLRGAQELLMDMITDPDEIKKRVGEIDKIYYEYYDRFYDLMKDEKGGSAYTVFQIWGPGKTVKLQCDISAMFSADNFREFVQDSLRQQAAQADNVLYHLDGADAIRHLDALMEIEGIDALQWTSGDYGPDGTLEDWDQIYDKVRAAGKQLWVKVYSGEFEDWIKNTERIVQKYGSHGLFLMFPEMSEAQAGYLTDYAAQHWSDVRGTFYEAQPGRAGGKSELI